MSETANEFAVPNKVGRPSKYSPDVGEKVLEVMSKGFSFTSAAAVVGVTPTTLHQWVHDHPEFSETVRIAKAARVLALEGTMLETSSAAVVGSRKFALINAQRLNPDNERDWAPENTQIAISNPDGSKLEVQDPVALAAAMAQAIAAGQQPADEDE